MRQVKVKTILNKTRLIAGLLIAVSLLFPALSYSLPEGEAVVEGAASFDRSTPNVLKINTSSDKLIVNYCSFCIASNECVCFSQPHTCSCALNRVTGQEVSNIFGTLVANGIIYLINPSGINIGSTANINASSFIASSLNISNTDFLAGALTFSKLDGMAGKPVINSGNIKAKEKGSVVLLGPAVSNEGTIEATLGSVVLAAGEKMTLNLDNAGMISVVIDEPVKESISDFGGEKLDSAVQNSGRILNPGGKVILAAKVLNDVFDYAINNTGIVQAQSLVSHDGVVELVAQGAPILNAGTIEATEVNVAAKAAPVTNAGRIKAEEVKVVSGAAPVVNSGTIEAPKVSITATESDFTNTGQITAAARENVTDAGRIEIQAFNIIHTGIISAADSIKLEALNAVLTPAIKTTNHVLAAGEPININPGIIIQAPSVRLITKQFGVTDTPLSINANYIYIGRTEGDIEVLQSAARVFLSGVLRKDSARLSTMTKQA